MTGLNEETCAALLRTLSAATSGAWRFVPAGGTEGAWRSPGCDSLFAPQHGESPNTADRVHSLMQSVDEFLRSGRSTAVVDMGDQALRITANVVLNDDGQFLGRLLRLSDSRPSEQLEELREAREWLARLSPRESDVLDLVYEGLTNKAIAAKTQISHTTVEKHRGRISRKLHTRSLAELACVVATARLADTADGISATHE